MEEQEKRVEDHAEGNGRSEPTRVGHVLRSLAPSATQQLPASQPQPRPAPVNSALRERVVTLVAALGDITHPLHQQAVHDLVEIGDPAVSALNEALNPRRPWLTAYRAAEALGQIGDGRATGPLIEALRHPNSNVRWSAVRALAALGDARALLDLRRVAREDRGKTSWGEPIAGAAASALEQMRMQNVLLRGADLLKTAVCCVIMLVALIFAWSTVTTLRAELRQFGQDEVPNVLVAPPSTAEPATESTDTGSAVNAVEPTPAPEVTPVPEETAVAASSVITGTVQTTANVRALPSRDFGQKIGTVSTGDEIIFVAMTPDREWYRIRIGERSADGSRIDSADSTGWVIESLLSIPATDPPIEEVALPDAAPQPEATPQP
jgi:hypothetical protein